MSSDTEKKTETTEPSRQSVEDVEQALSTQHWSQVLDDIRSKQENFKLPDVKDDVKSFDEMIGASGTYVKAETMLNQRLQGKERNPLRIARLSAGFVPTNISSRNKLLADLKTMSTTKFESIEGIWNHVMKLFTTHLGTFANQKHTWYDDACNVMNFHGLI
jgi:hypothetical protein